MKANNKKATQRIKDCIESQSPYLDLSELGLKKFTTEQTLLISQLSHLDGLNLRENLFNVLPLEIFNLPI